MNQGTFEIENGETPKYWIVPLSNFISTFHFNRYAPLNRHPLRQYTTPLVPEFKEDQQRQTALLAANSRNHLISFSFGKKVGFIEPLPDYKEKKGKLESGQFRQCPTALMISEVTDDINDIWFPQIYANLLSFASGAEVSALWLEIRDKTGKLVRRRHFPTLKSSYEKGYAVIPRFSEDILSHFAYSFSTNKFKHPTS